MSRRVLAICIAMAVCVAAPVFGQAVSGTILGTVTDVTGAVRPNAKVTVVNEGTGLTRTMNADGNLYLLEHAVARLILDANGHIKGAEPAIHKTLKGFEDLQVAPPGDKLQSNKKTPFVWADSES